MNISSYKGQAPLGCDAIFSNHLARTETIDISNPGSSYCYYRQASDLDFPQKCHLQSASKVRGAKTSNTKYLWTKDPPTAPTPDIPFELMLKNLDRYVVFDTKLEHLELSFYASRGSFSDFHPLYWLWNIPSLKSCSMRILWCVALDFSSKCDQMLESALIAQCSRMQTDFRSLCLKLDLETDCLPHFNHEYVLFTRKINAMYPHLTAQTYILTSLYCLKKPPRDCMDLDTSSLSFQGIETLCMGVVTMRNAIDLLSELHGRRRLKNVSVKVLRNKFGKEGWIMNELINSIFGLVRENGDHTDSVKVEVDFKSGRGEAQCYWDTHINYLSSLLTMTNDGIIFDGYLEFIPGVWNCSRTWNKMSIAKSLRLSQIVSEIHTRVLQYNQALEATDCIDKKLIIHIPSLEFHKEHMQFHQFWFGTAYCHPTFALY